MKHWLYIVLMVVVLSGCSRKVYTPLENEVKDSVSVVTEVEDKSILDTFIAHADKVEATDSVILRDSIVIVVREDGSLLSKERFRDTERIHRRDTDKSVVAVKSDSTTKVNINKVAADRTTTTQVPVPVEKKLSIWERIGNVFEMINVAAILIAVGYLIVWLVKIFRHKDQ